ncbi:MAG: 23S rRNA (adenine(2503)-C(2))-methyltransferase RlmN, partial [Bacillota bacterium]
GRLAHVNLIPVNYVEETGFFPADSENVKQFAEIVESYNVEATVREKKGTDIDAACGQLRKRVKSAE